MRVIQTIFKDSNVYYITEDFNIYKYQSNTIENKKVNNNDIVGLEIIDNKLFVFNQYIMDVESTDDNIVQEIIE
jgi:hypothetical protein